MNFDIWLIESLRAMRAMAPENVSFLFWSLTKSEYAAWAQALLSGFGIFFSVWMARWSIRVEHKRIKLETEKAEKKLAVDEEKERRRAEAHRVDMMARADRFIRNASAYINSVNVAAKSNPSKYDVLLKGPIVQEELLVSRSIDLAALDAVSATTVISAQSLCEYLEVLMQEERHSLANPPLSHLKNYLPELNSRMFALEDAWKNKRYPGASYPISAD
jgi:hypothetical protein